MSLQRTRLTEVAFLSNAAASVYANPADTKSFVRGILLHNTNSTTETVTIHWVPDTAAALGTAAAGNRIFKADLVANETLMWELPFALVLLDENEAIFGLSTTANKVTIAILGDKDA